MHASAAVAVRGRDAEAEAVDAIVDGVANRRGGALLLEGPAGLGKTTLLTAAAARASARGLRVVRVRGGALTATSPWSLAVQLVDGLVGATATPPPHQRLHGPAARALQLLDGPIADGSLTMFPIVHGVACAVRDVALERPVMIIVDDAHCADPQSAAVIEALAQRIGDAPFGVLLARRPPTAADDASTLLDRIAASGVVQRIALPPLDERAMDAIVGDLAPTATAEMRSELVVAAAGNPLLAREAAELLLRVDGGRLGESAREGDESALSALIRGDEATVLRRATLARLGAAGDRALVVAAAIAVLGPYADYRRIAELADVGRAECADVLDALQRTGVIAVGDDIAEIRHPMLEEMILAEAGAARVAATHRDAAELLHEAGENDAAIVAHLLAAGGVDSSRDRSWVQPTLRREAARRLSLGGATDAASLLRLALPLATHLGARVETTLELARAEAAAGETSGLDRVDSVSGEMLAAGGWDERSVVLLAEIGEAFYAAGRFLAAEATFDRALAALEADDVPVQRALAGRTGAMMTLIARLFVGRSSASLLGGHDRRLDGSVRRVIGDAGDVPSLAVRLLAAMHVGERALGVDIPRDELGRLIEVVGIGDALPLELPRPVYEPIGTALTMAGRADEAVTLLSTLLDGAARRGDMASHVSVLPIRAYASIRLGRVDDALADALDALRLGEAMPGVSRYAEAPARYVGAIAHLERDESAAARTMVTVDDHAERWSGSPVHGWFMSAVGLVEAAEGRGHDAAAAFELAGRSFTTCGGSGTVTAWRSGMVPALYARGEVDRAERLLADELAGATALGDTRLIAENRQTAAALERDHASAAAMLETVAADLGSVGAPLTLTSVELDLGRRLRRAGERRRARRVLSTAIERARSLGARRLERIAVDELGAAGARRPVAARSGVTALTPAEHRVCRLVSEGRTNREVADALFVNIKTVETQLAAAFRKLGIAKRAELVGVLIDS